MNSLDDLQHCEGCLELFENKSELTDINDLLLCENCVEDYEAGYLQIIG